MQGSSPIPRLLARGVLRAGAAALAILNGWPFASLFDSAAYIVFLFTRCLRLDPSVIEILATALIAGMTLLLAGIPAALYERVRGLRQSTPVSLGIWLAAAALLAYQPLGRVTGLW